MQKRRHPCGLCDGVMQRSATVERRLKERKAWHGWQAKGMSGERGRRSWGKRKEEQEGRSSVGRDCHGPSAGRNRPETQWSRRPPATGRATPVAPTPIPGGAIEPPCRSALPALATECTLSLIDRFRCAWDPFAPGLFRLSPLPLIGPPRGCGRIVGQESEPGNETLPSHLFSFLRGRPPGAS